MKYPDIYFSVSIQGCNGIAHNVCMVKSELCLFTLRQPWKLHLKLSLNFRPYRSEINVPKV